MLLRIGFYLTAALVLASCDGAAKQEREIERTFGVFTGGEQLRVTVDDRNGFASATGVWTIEGDDKIADPINISKIWCDRSENYCEDQRSFITAGVGRPMLMATSELYKITSWNDGRVRAELAEPSCRTIELVVSEIEKSVTTVTRQRGKCDELTPPIDKPRLGVLISGRDLDKRRGL
jgi:hypothetical protein